jgi:hypothetical protein
MLHDSAGGFVDVFEIRGIIETYRTDLKNSIESTFSVNSINLFYFTHLRLLLITERV